MLTAALRHAGLVGGAAAGSASEALEKVQSGGIAGACRRIDGWERAADRLVRRGAS